jgi:tyrosyl-tRNA synthetase
MGGSDQWGNITTGTEFIRRKANGEAYALTTPLVTKADGSKFGKSEGGNVWLDANMTSPYKFYQFWLNVADEEVPMLIRRFTLKTREEIESLEKAHLEAPHLRVLQKALAEDITVRVHSQEDLDNATKASRILFGKSTTEELNSIDERTLLSVFEGVPKIDVSRNDYDNVSDLLTFLAETTLGEIFPSKGEARRMVSGGGVSINKEKIADLGLRPDFQLLQDKYLLLQKGKKNYYLIEVLPS